MCDRLLEGGRLMEVRLYFNVRAGQISIFKHLDITAHAHTW